MYRCTPDFQDIGTLAGLEILALHGFHLWFQTICFHKNRGFAWQPVLHCREPCIRNGGFKVLKFQESRCQVVVFSRPFGARGHGWFYCVWWPQSCVFLACDSWNSWIQSGPKLTMAVFCLDPPGLATICAFATAIPMVRQPGKWTQSLVRSDNDIRKTSRPKNIHKGSKGRIWIILAFFKVACGIQHDLRDIYFHVNLRVYRSNFNKTLARKLVLMDL